MILGRPGIRNIANKWTWYTMAACSITLFNNKIKAENQDVLPLQQRAEKVLTKAKEHVSIEAAYREKAARVLRQYYELQGRTTCSDSQVPEQLDTFDKESGISANKFFKKLEFETTELCVPFVIVGGGTAAWSAVEAIYEKKPSAQVLVITEEDCAPYNRTPLSKEMWSMEQQSIRKTLKSLQATKEVIQSPEDYNASILTNTYVEDVFPQENKIKLSNGCYIFYKKLLLATGGTPVISELMSSSAIDPAIEKKVFTFRGFHDYERLYRTLEDPNNKNITVLGGGFLGSELACSLQNLLKQSSKENNTKITLLCPEAGVLAKYLPRYLSDHITKKVQQFGIDVRPGVSIFHMVPNMTANKEPSRILLQLFGWKENEHVTDEVVIAVGIYPRQELAERAGLETDPVAGGIRVNAAMHVEGDIYAAGDVASFWDRSLGRRRVEHWDHAVVTGRIAGANMCDENAIYDWQSMFWCDLVGLNVSFEATGIIDSSLRTVGVWNVHNHVKRGEFADQDLRDGVVWYLRGDCVVGALLWNREGKGLETAKKAIGSKLRISSVKDLTYLIPVVDEKSGHAPFVVDTSVLGSQQ
eukprot:jgi/Galph1/1760/GphlegSOOS_G456.1